MIRRFFHSTIKEPGILDHPNLVAYWGFNEGSGTVLFDDSANANNATISGNITWTAGVKNQCIIFDGSSYASVPHNASLNITDQITISSFVRPNANNTQYMIKKAIINSSIGNGWELSMSSTGKFFFRINQFTNANTYRVDSTSNYPTNGTWIHVAGTYDGTTLKIYMNGVLENSVSPTPTSIATNNLALAIGAQSGGSSSLSNGTRLDDTRLYNIALTAEEIAEIASIL